MNQVAKNKRLLDIAKDCFQFVTKFFEVINVSAPHIYHSALELCPMSSIIRKLYYCQRIIRLPKVVIGTPDSWDQTIAISSKDRYNGLCTWSPCGRSVAAQSRKAVEIRNQLTLELITTLQPTGTIPHLTGPLAYSPDGRSIACASDTAIIIWDIQTGGVAEEIKCSPNNISLVWSSDGGTICTIDSDDRVGPLIVHTYDISSGTTSSPGTLRSSDKPYLWTHDKSFWVMTTVRYSDDGINIFKVGSTLTKIRSFVFSPLYQAVIGSFSPTTHRVSISDGYTLRIFDTQDSKRLLDATGYSSLSHCFSSDGSLFAASQESGVHIWKYASGCYNLWREFRCQGPSNSLRFSPTPSSILGHCGDILQVWRLHELPAAPKTNHQQCAGLSRSGTRVVTAHKLGNTVKIIDLLAQTPPQFIDTNVEIEGLVLTGNVLLVAGSRKLIAWLLTEEGLVDGVIGDRRVGRSDSIWTIPQSGYLWMFRVEGQAGVIELHRDALHVYHTETGEVLHPIQEPRRYSGHRYYLSDALRGRDYLRYHNLSQCNTPSEDSWQTSRATLREGWVKDPEGKHRLWVPVEWRTEWDPADWRHDVTTQFSYLGDRPVIIKF